MPLPALLDAFEALPPFGALSTALPAPGSHRGVAGLFGSADAVLVAALARRHAGRFFVIVADGVPEAERWLADLDALTEATPVALYPPREGFGEVEPHAEVAGERVETLERIGRGEVRILLTTSRAILERTRLPGAVRAARVELRKGESRRPEALATHLESIGYESVAMVEDVAQFSVRGGIFDVYGFGMTDPVRLEFWGDEISEMRHFDLHTQRSTRAAEYALVLPVDGSVADAAGEFDRVTLADLWSPDTVVVYPLGVRPETELERTWEEAAHHIELARRRGEEAPARDELYQAPDATLRTLATFGRIAIRGAGEAAQDGAPVVFPTRTPDAIDRDVKRLRRIVRDGMPTVILCDNA